MKFYKLLVYGLIVFLFIACAAKTDHKNNTLLQKQIKSLNIEKFSDGNYTLQIEGDETIKYQVFYSKSPYKLTIFGPDSLFDEAVMKYNYSDDLVSKVVTYVGNQGATVEVYLNADIDYKYNEKVGKLTVDFSEIKTEIKKLGESGIDFSVADFEDIALGKNVNSIINMSDMNNLLIKISVDGIVKYDYGYLNDKLLYIDLFDVKNKISKKRLPGKGVVKKIRVGSYYPPQKVRFLIDLKRSGPVFAGQNGRYFILSNEMNNVPKDAKYITSIESVSVKKYQSIIVKLTGRPIYSKQIINGNLVLEFDKNVKALKTVKNIMTFSELPFRKVKVGKVDGKLSLIIVPNGEIYAKVEKTPEGVMISGSFEEFSKAEEVLKASESKKAENAKNSLEQYDKKDLVTLSLKDMDVREAIRLIYYGRAKNIVFGNEVKGKVNLYVKNVPYRRALDIVYNENNLVEVNQDNIIWVISKARKEQIEARKLKAIKDKEAKKKLEPLVTEIIPVNYSSASDYKGVIDSVLTARGKLQIESRTNSFVITDTKEGIENAKKLLAEIDIPTPQVTIEARIVEVFDSNNVNLGIQWGGQINRSTTAYDFPATVNLTGNTGASSSAGNGYLVNLPVGAPAGALALTLGSISGKYALDIALSALESQNKAKTISSPRITTLDNEEAEIKSGGTAIIVPTGDNTNTEEIDVGIKLKVKPHITANKMVYMEIEVEKSSLGSVTGNTATTEEKKAKTQVLLASGDTTVIGGIYEDEQRVITQSVPGLGDIPFLGWLFKSKNNISTKKELLVFLTPKVVQ